MVIRRNSKPWKILKCLLLTGGFLVLAGIAPAGGAEIVKNLIKGYFRKKRFEREKFLRDIKHLQDRKLIDYKELPNGKLRIVLTKKGKEKILEYSIDDIHLETKKRWDGQWRMIIFDIPESKKKARDALREKLTQLEFYQIQESVYLIPYECEREMEFICSVFDIRQYVLLFYISHFEGEEKIRYHFRM